MSDLQALADLMLSHYLEGDMRRTVFIPGYGNERDFQATVEADLLRMGFRTYAIPDSRRARGVGYPDITFTGHGIWGVLELKVGRNKSSDEQRAWIREASRAGLYAAIIWPDAWPEVRDHLAERVKA